MTNSITELKSSKAKEANEAKVTIMTVVILTDAASKIGRAHDA